MKRALIYTTLVLATACARHRVIYVEENAPATREQAAPLCEVRTHDDDFFARDWPRGPDDFDACAPQAFPYQQAPEEPPSGPPNARRPLRFLARALRRGDLAEASAIIADLEAEEADGTRLLTPGQRLIVTKLQGTIALERKSYAAAEAHSRRAIDLGQELHGLRARRHTAEAHYNLGVSLYYQEQIEEAHQELRRYEILVQELGGAITPRDAYHLGVTAYLSGDRQAAYDYFAEADPELRARAARVLEDPEIQRAGT